MKFFYQTARYLVGALFIFSGLIKINDPVGTAIKLEEYFDVFAYDFAPFFEWFIPAALFFSVLLCVLEVVLGIALIIGYQIRHISWVLLLLIIFFSFLTFYSAYFNKVTDCGCFGDAIKLTPWQSFIKDMILLVLVVAIFINRKYYSNSWFSFRFGTAKMILATITLTFLAIYAIRHLPFIDFRAYAVGNHLPTLMQPSEDPKYEYVMEKDGQEYTFDSYPADKSYAFKSMELTNPESQAKITDLSVWNDEGEYTDELMSGNKLLIIISNVEKASTRHTEEINTLARELKGVDVWVLTASGHDEYEHFRHEEQLAIPYFFADATVLKTMIRSNPGLILLSNGTVKGKWHHNDIPTVAEINKFLK